MGSGEWGVGSGEWGVGTGRILLCPSVPLPLCPSAPVPVPLSLCSLPIPSPHYR